MHATAPVFENTLSSTHLAARQIARSKLLILLAAVISFVLSVSLWFMGHENQGIFVGLWVPSILSFGSLMLSGRSTDTRP
ncbi:MAG: hypothetical protein NVSMB2_10960 [Chloroflexota bacterium]